MASCRAGSGNACCRSGRRKSGATRSYTGVLAAIALTILSGLAIWKPVQLQELTWLLGGFQSARVIHFLGMAAIVLFVVVHLALVALVPRTLPPMITGTARLHGDRP